MEKYTAVQMLGNVKDKILINQAGNKVSLLNVEDTIEALFLAVKRLDGYAFLMDNDESVNVYQLYDGLIDVIARAEVYFHSVNLSIIEKEAQRQRDLENGRC